MNRTIERAGAIARKNGHGAVTLEHLLLSALDEADVTAVVTERGADVGELRADLEAALARENIETDAPALIPETPSFRRTIQRAFRGAKNEGRAPHLHILPAMFSEGETDAVALLRKQGLSRAALNEATETVSPTEAGAAEQDGGAVGQPIRKNKPGSKTAQGLLIDLVALAEAGRLDPVAGRDDETDRLVHTLCRHRKNNPLLVGDPGVGKTALVEGLAIRIVLGSVPEPLLGTRILSLDAGALLAGTRYRGDLEERLKAVVAEIEKDPKAILFIDEIEALVGTSGSTGGPDALDILKPAFARGTIRCIAATTHAAYGASLGKNGGLARRFQRIDVDEPSHDEAVRIAAGRIKAHERHHGVSYVEDAAKIAVRLTSRHLHDRKLPDKAIDALDEAGALVRLSPEKNRPKRVGRDEIARAVARMARIPEPVAGEDETTALLALDERIKAEIHGQDEAVAIVADAIRMARSGMREPEKPIANLLFSGPTGVGKTELARVVAKLTESALVRFDMSECMEKQGAARLIGAPPGYVGFEQGGQLTEAVAKTPHAVILLDEIEKAHPDVLNVLLQVMDHGRLTDGTGRVADFRNAIIIMTTNAGAEDAQRSAIGFTGTIDGDPSKAEAAISRTFSPEFRNRLDAVASFKTLSEDAIRSVARKEIGKAATLLAAKEVAMTTSDEAVEWFAKNGKDPKMGARPMARLVAERVRKPAAGRLLSGALPPGSAVALELDSVGEPILVIRSGEKNEPKKGKGRGTERKTTATA
jgi:ATP-dependent Clp protease ATP-binding subunit ClpA